MVNNPLDPPRMGSLPRGLAAPKIIQDDHEGPSVGASAAELKRAAADKWEANEQRMAAAKVSHDDFVPPRGYRTTNATVFNLRALI